MLTLYGSIDWSRCGCSQEHKRGTSGRFCPVAVPIKCIQAIRPRHYSVHFYFESKAIRKNIYSWTMQTIWSVCSAAKFSFKLLLKYKLAAFYSGSFDSMWEIGPWNLSNCKTDEQNFRHARNPADHARARLSIDQAINQAE